MSDNQALHSLDGKAESLPGPVYPELKQSWIDHCHADRYLWITCAGGPNEPTPPRPLSREQLAALIGSLFYPPHRRILQELLLELLGEGIVAIVGALQEGASE